MRVRIIAKVLQGETWLMPGEILDLDEATAQALIENEQAVDYPAEVEEVSKPKRGKAVNNGNG